ncbi:hypothetical protein BRETT_001100 [Brettanomyces bruxellensis]|uniref:Uncharacterized protein n=1 Tax=Dekkera bruxellensis TaxID=5007 RepID=A0A871RC70_DEKBR|nr:uncharacterized protein BRETT_001100 [Brettanomyces bruxellensis]QOU21378.1 hypothetical protein BRETT_001100 [Brettanomyces bruxellensis]
MVSNSREGNIPESEKNQTISEKPDVQATKPFTNKNQATQSDSKITRLSHVIIKSTLTGVLYGALFSIPTDLLLRWKSPLYRSFGNRIRIFYNTIVLTYAASFVTETNVRKLEAQMRAEEAEKRKKLIEWSVEHGVYTGAEEGYYPEKK